MFERLRSKGEKIKANFKEASNKVKVDVKGVANKVKESTGIKEKHDAELRTGIDCYIALSNAQQLKPLIENLIGKITANKSLLSDEKLQISFKQTFDSIAAYLDQYTTEYKDLENTFFGFYKKLDELTSKFNYVFKTLSI